MLASAIAAAMLRRGPTRVNPLLRTLSWCPNGPSPGRDGRGFLFRQRIGYFLGLSGVERSSRNEIVIVVYTATGLPVAVRAGS